MSLINEALKKAQRQRNEEQGTDVPPTPGGTSIAKRGPGRSPQAVLLIGGGAFALVIVSVVTTVWLVNRKPDGPPTSAPVATTTPDAAPSPAAVKEPAPQATEIRNPTLPSGVPPASATQSTTVDVKQSGLIASAPAPAAAPPAVLAPTPAATPPPTAPAASPLTSASPSPAVATTPTAEPPSAPASPAASSETATPSARLEERILAFVDAARVAGVRTSGGDSRVLMNDRVYRVNDIVNRSLGLKLIKVTADTLTFADASGATYEKTF